MEEAKVRSLCQGALATAPVPHCSEESSTGFFWVLYYFCDSPSPQPPKKQLVNLFQHKILTFILGSLLHFPVVPEP